MTTKYENNEIVEFTYQYDHKYSDFLFQEQKRKISIIKINNENNKDNTTNNGNDKTLVYTPVTRSKNKPRNSSEKEPVVSEFINHYEDTEKEMQSNGKFEPLNLKNKDLNLTLEDFDSWDYSSFDYEIIESEDVPIINQPFWPFEELEGYNKENGVDIRNIVLKSICQFNMAK